jgi:hypothetical protein
VENRSRYDSSLTFDSDNEWSEQIIHCGDRAIAGRRWPAGAQESERGIGLMCGGDSVQIDACCGGVGIGGRFFDSLDLE